MSQPTRILNTFFAPSKTFGSLHRNPTWWMAWLLLVLVSYGYVYTMDKKIGVEQITQSEIAKNTRAAEPFDRMAPEQRQQALERAARISRIIYYIVPVFSLVFYLIIAAVLMATFNFGLGTEVPFKVALAITIYGLLPSGISAIVGIVSMVAGVHPEGFNARNPVASNPAYFMDPLAHKFLYGLLSGLDVFSLWSVVLLGIGFACQSKVKRSTAIMVVLGWFVLVKLAGAGWAAMS